MNRSQKIIKIFEGNEAEALCQKFAKMLQTKVDKYYKETYPNIKIGQVSVKPGRSYIKIDLGGSGKFMYDPIDGCLYFIKGYGVIDKKKNFGRLEDIVKKDFEFDGYSIMPKGMKGRTQYGYAGRIA